MPLAPALVGISSWASKLMSFPEKASIAKTPIYPAEVFRETHDSPSQRHLCSIGILTAVARLGFTQPGENCFRALQQHDGVIGLSISRTEQ
jgi:hypothetical protein